MEHHGQHCKGFYLYNVVPRVLRQQWSELFLVQCFFWGGLLDNIAQGFYLFNVGPWLTDNFCEKNSLCNVVLTMLGQHCIRILSSQCFLNVSLNGNIIQKNTVQHWPWVHRPWFCRKISHSIVLICLSQHCPRKLPLQCWPRAHRYTFAEKPGF